jgi:hypothetical protein
VHRRMWLGLVITACSLSACGATGATGTSAPPSAFHGSVTLTDSAEYTAMISYSFATSAPVFNALLAHPDYTNLLWSASGDGSITNKSSGHELTLAEFPVAFFLFYKASRPLCTAGVGEQVDGYCVFSIQNKNGLARPTLAPSSSKSFSISGVLIPQAEIKQSQRSAVKADIASGPNFYAFATSQDPGSVGSNGIRLSEHGTLDAKSIPCSISFQNGDNFQVLASQPSGLSCKRT